MKFRIRYALNGGFGGCEVREWEVIDADSLEEADDEAHRCAIEEYESMVGMHGLRTEEEIMEEEEVSEDEAKEIYLEEMEGWLDWEAEEYEDE